MSDVIPAPQQARVPVRGGGSFPVHRIYCVGRNFADHAREMGSTVATSKAERGQPTLFAKPADAIVTGNADVPYPPGTADLHHEVELVVALGADAPPGVLAPEAAASLIYGYAIGLDLTRRDLQATARKAGMPWDTAKGFDHSAPISELVPASAVPDLSSLGVALTVNGRVRQQAPLTDMIWDVPDILHALSGLYALKAGDLVFMGTPAGVAALQPGDVFVGTLDGVAEVRGTITA
jgi:fumarylpyruvate hydrolase